MDFNNVNCDLSSLLQSDNGCPYSSINDDIIDSVFLTKKNVLNVLHVNIRSYHKNIDYLLLLLKELQEKGIVMHVIGLCETFLNDVNSTMVVIENYQCIHKFRKNKLGGVVSLFVHDNVTWYPGTS